MSSGNPREVSVDVLPPLPGDMPHTSVQTAFPESTPALSSPSRFYHPASGVVILGLDWFAFGTDVLTDFLALPVMCVLAFLASFVLIYQIQTKIGKDSAKAATGKAFLGAFLVGLPFPITGTMLGAAILALSGLPHHPIEIVMRLISSRTLAK